MAKTVKAAFDAYRATYIDLSPIQTTNARRSRDYLLDQIKNLGTDNPRVPSFTAKRELFGSFARKTKIAPLDDIDLMPLLDPTGVCIESSGVSPALRIEDDAKLSEWADNGYLNSRRILDAVKTGLSKVPNYGNAEIHRNQQAVTLKLSSYTWNFDIVPSFAAYQGAVISHYIIPDGAGGWSRSDPRKAQEQVTNMNIKHQEQFIPAARILKYWKKKKGLSDIPSFAFEVFAVLVFSYLQQHAEIHLAFGCFFDKAVNHVFSHWPDPAGFSGDLSLGVVAEAKARLHAAVNEGSKVANEAYRFEQRDDHESAINIWRKYLGAEFPEFG